MTADGNHDAHGTGKLTNPKDVIGSTKLPIELVPETAIAVESLSFLEGALKYGRYNWRVAGVRSSIYAAALLRHAFKWWNGEDVDPDTHVPHLASVRACAAILVDAGVCGKLTDDRPPPAPLGAFIAECEATAKHLRELFKDHDPKQWTIADVVVRACDVALEAESRRDKLSKLCNINTDLTASVAWEVAREWATRSVVRWEALDRLLGVDPNSMQPESRRAFLAAWDETR